jgi:biotin synthase
MTSDNRYDPPAIGRGRHEFILQWLRQDESDAVEQLMLAAGQTRVQFVGKAIGLWGTIKLSNHCDDDCGFCGLRAGNTALHRFRLSTDEVLTSAKIAKQAGCDVVTLQSGRDPALPTDWVSEIIRRIREEAGLAVALSFGERSEAELAAWRRAGASSYMLRFMTANTTLYRLLHAQACDDPRRRLPMLAMLKELGYKVGSGIMVGFPGQSMESLADDLEFLRRLDLDTVLIGPYVWPAELSQAIQNVQDSDANSAVRTLKVLALARQLCPGADIPSTSALASVGGPAVHAAALRSGANIVIADFTPAIHLAQYRCYPDRVVIDERSWNAGAAGLRAIVQPASSPGSPDKLASALPDSPSLHTDQQPIHVCVCMGSSCFSRGNNRTVAAIRDFIAAKGLADRATLEGQLCEGQCKDGPNITVGDETHHRATPQAIIALLRQRLNIRE